MYEALLDPDAQDTTVDETENEDTTQTSSHSLDKQPFSGPVTRQELEQNS